MANGLFGFSREQTARAGEIEKRQQGALGLAASSDPRQSQFGLGLLFGQGAGLATRGFLASKGLAPDFEASRQARAIQQFMDNGFDPSDPDSFSALAMLQLEEGDMAGALRSMTAQATVAAQSAQAQAALVKAGAAASQAQTAAVKAASQIDLNEARVQRLKEQTFNEETANAIKQQIANLKGVDVRLKRKLELTLENFQGRVESTRQQMIARGASAEEIEATIRSLDFTPDERKILDELNNKKALEILLRGATQDLTFGVPELDLTQ